jgi:hypothetical protein
VLLLLELNIWLIDRPIIADSSRAVIDGGIHQA